MTQGDTLLQDVPGLNPRCNQLRKPAVVWTAHKNQMPAVRRCNEFLVLRGSCRHRDGWCTSTSSSRDVKQPRGRRIYAESRGLRDSPAARAAS